MVLMRSLVEFVIIFVITETPNTINSRTLVLASFGGGKLTVKCPSPETLRETHVGLLPKNTFLIFPSVIFGLPSPDHKLARVSACGIKLDIYWLGRVRCKGPKDST